MTMRAIIILGAGLLTACVQATPTGTASGSGTSNNTAHAGSSGAIPGSVGSTQQGNPDAGMSSSEGGAATTVPGVVQGTGSNMASPGENAAFDSGLSGRWTLIEIGGAAYRPAARERPPFFNITGNQITGHDGCNSFIGPLQPAGQISATRIACPGGATLPLDLSNVAAQLARAQITGNILTVPERAGMPGSRYRRD